MSETDDEYEFEQGDVFTGPGGPIQVKSVGPFGEYLTVTDPTDHHPQSARAGSWNIEASELVDDLYDGTVEEASIEVVAE